jgi:hypothetical protein
MFRLDEGSRYRMTEALTPGIITWYLLPAGRTLEAETCSRSLEDTPCVTAQGCLCRCASTSLTICTQPVPKTVITETKGPGDPVGSKITGPDGAPSLLGNTPQSSEVCKQPHILSWNMSSKPPSEATSTVHTHQARADLATQRAWDN